MAARDAIWKRLTQVRLDDVSYDIRAKEHEDGRFTVAWVCLRCCEQGPPIPADEFLERAVSFAQIGVRTHHQLVHAEAGRHFGFGEAGAPFDGQNDALCTPCDECRAAYEQLRHAFDELCTAQAKLRFSTAHSLSSANARREFDAALGNYSDEVNKREQAVGDDRQPFTARPTTASRGAHGPTNGSAP